MHVDDERRDDSEYQWIREKSHFNKTQSFSVGNKKEEENAVCEESE